MDEGQRSATDISTRHRRSDLRLLEFLCREQVRQVFFESLDCGGDRLGCLSISLHLGKFFNYLSVLPRYVQ